MYTRTYQTHVRLTCALSLSISQSLRYGIVGGFTDWADVEPQTIHRQR